MQAWNTCILAWVQMVIFYPKIHLGTQYYILNWACFSRKLRSVPAVSCGYTWRHVKPCPMPNRPIYQHKMLLCNLRKMRSLESFPTMQNVRVCKNVALIRGIWLARSIPLNAPLLFRSWRSCWSCWSDFVGSCSSWKVCKLVKVRLAFDKGTHC